MNLDRFKKRTSLISCPNKFCFLTRYFRGVVLCTKSRTRLFINCYQLSVFANKSVRTCPIKLKISMLYHMKNNLRNTVFSISVVLPLTLSWRRPIPYRNQFIDLLCKSMDLFLYDNGLRHERVKKRDYCKWLFKETPLKILDYCRRPIEILTVILKREMVGHNYFCKTKKHSILE